MNARSILAFAALVCASVLSSGPAAAAPFEVVRYGRAEFLSPSPSTLQVEVLRTREELEALWNSLGRSPAFLPDVDFQGRALIAVFLGHRPEPHRIEVEDVQVREGTLVVSIVETTPGRCCVTVGGPEKPEAWLLTIPWKHEVEVQLRQVERTCRCE